MEPTKDTEETTPLAFRMSTGAGIAIATIWLVMAALSALIMMVLFVWTDMSPAPRDADSAFWTLIFMVAAVIAPLILAYSITKKILGMNDD